MLVTHLRNTYELLQTSTSLFRLCALFSLSGGRLLGGGALLVRHRLLKASWSTGAGTWAARSAGKLIIIMPG